VVRLITQSSGIALAESKPAGTANAKFSKLVWKCSGSDFGVPNSRWIPTILGAKTMKFDEMGFVFQQEDLRLVLLGSVLSVWVLVGFLIFLNRYIRREYFAVWTAAWVFYALWLTLSLRMGDPGVGSIIFSLKQCCVSMAAVCILWGSIRFLGLPFRRRMLCGFVLFLAVWIYVSTQVMVSVLLVEFPVFMLLSLSTPVAGLSVIQLRKRKSHVGAGMLSLGFMLWGIYFGSYPFSHQYGRLYSTCFLVAAVVQFFVAAGIIVLVLEEIHAREEQIREQNAALRLKKVMWRTSTPQLKNEPGSPTIGCA
jgi:hypothetical protein